MNKIKDFQRIALFCVSEFTVFVQVNDEFVLVTPVELAE